ncbi:MAG: hypothetical protein Q8784_02340 [Vigna little leaf phytoplasma]|nr:hypothetical protein [Vigna little leaf phytoplasma]
MLLSLKESFFNQKMSKKKETVHVFLIKTSYFKKIKIKNPNYTRAQECLKVKRIGELPEIVIISN